MIYECGDSMDSLEKLKSYKRRIDELKHKRDKQHKVLTTKEKTELESLQRKYKDTRNKIIVKTTGKVAVKVVKAIVGFISSLISTLVALLGTVGMVILIVVVVVIILITVLSSLVGSDWFKNIGLTTTIPQRGTAGARYEFNSADLDILESEYSKNIYLTAWLWTNVKEMSGDSITISIANAMGEPIYEYGGGFFNMYDTTYENNLISDYACGFPTSADASNICQGLYQCNSSDFNEDALNYWGNYGYTSLEEVTAKAWEGIPRGDLSGGLKAPTGADAYVYSYWDDAKAKGDYTATVYDAGYQVMYAGYINGSYRKALTGDNVGAHTYKTYYQNACETYGLDASSEAVHNWFLNSIAYVFHAGSMSGSFTSDTYKDMALNAAFDYLGYIYSNYYAEADSIAYDLDNYANWGTPGGASNKIMLENTYSYTKAVEAGNRAFGTNCEPFDTSSETYMSSFDGNKVLENNIAHLWYNSLDGERKENADIFRKAFMYDTSVVDSLYPGSQGAYAHLAGWATALGGTSRLNYVFDQLDIEWTINDKGYICYKGGNGGIAINTVGVNPAVVVDKFDSSKPSYWQKDWFETLDESEWAYPIDYGDGTAAHISSLFGERDYNNNEFHCGLDMAYLDAATKDYKTMPIYAMHDGKIINITENHHNCGNYIMYECTWKVFDSASGEWKYKTGRFLYMHMAAFAEGLSEGQTINKGDILGYMGGTGGVAVHLHMQMSTTGVSEALADSGIRNISTELPFTTWWNGYESYVESGIDGRLKGAPIKLGYSTSDGKNADTATNSDEHP